MWNWIDLTRLAIMYFIVITFDHEEPTEKWILALVLGMVWLKIIKYLQVFKTFRYLIQMCFDVIHDLRTFMLVLMIFYAAYTQIMITLSDDFTSAEVMRSSYGLLYGDFGDYTEFDTVKFVVFVFFTFVIPLVLMNLLIAIMSDSYARV